MQGPQAVTQSAAPASDERPDHTNASSLPQQTGASLRQAPSEQQTSGNTQVTAVSPTGGLGGTAPVSPSVVLGIRDLRLIKRLVGRPDWQMPAGCETSLPLQAFMIARNIKRDGTPAEYSPHMQLKGVETLMKMEDANRRKIAGAVRLSQLNRRTNVVEEHPELMGGNVNNVVIILPEKASPGEFALPSERVIDAKPSGNGHGKA